MSENTIENLDSIFCEGFMEVFRLQSHSEPTPNSFYAPDAASVQLMEDDGNSWNSTRIVVSFILVIFRKICMQFLFISRFIFWEGWGLSYLT